MKPTKRDLLKAGAVLPLAMPAVGKAATRGAGPFRPAWESLLEHYRTPDWFRDAKFGIWAHWSAQCVPEQGDWYGRRMYLQGDPAYDYHVKTYGHPSQFGLMELQNLWKAERWEPERLIGLYKQAGTKYFVSMANHHDNFDAYNSRYHKWNSVRVGPKKDIVGIWEKLARAEGLRFGVSNHSSWAPRWLQPAYGYDGEGPMAGIRYDAATLTKTAGKGKWWEGLDPQELYTGPSLAVPAGLKSAEAVRNWHARNTNLARSNPLPSQTFMRNWFLRCRDLIDTYRPDLVYFDTNELPLEQVGLDIAAHYYNASAQRNGGRADVVINGKHIAKDHVGAFVEDIERGVAQGIRPDPWQTCSCIGQWHYDRNVAQSGGYKSVAQVVRMLVDIVSKNGNLLLNIPQRGDGSIDDPSLAFLEGLSQWMQVHGDALYGSRPWTIFGEGPTADNPQPRPPGTPKEAPIPYTSQDIRFITKGGALYAFVLAPPQMPQVRVTRLQQGAPLLAGKVVRRVTLLGYGGEVAWSQTGQGLEVKLPDTRADQPVLALKIEADAAFT